MWELVCSMCFDGTGHYRPIGTGCAQCETCGHVVNLAKDIEPYLEDGERLTVANNVVQITNN